MQSMAKAERKDIRLLFLPMAFTLERVGGRTFMMRLAKEYRNDDAGSSVACV